MNDMAANTPEGVTPFWQRIPKFFVYPAQPGPLIYLGALAAASIFGLLSTLILIVVELALWITFLRYAFVVLEHTSFGHLEPPKTLSDVNRSDDKRPYKQIGAFLILGIVAGVVQVMLTPLLGGLATLGSMLVQATLPAVIMLIAISDDFGHALNPASIIHTIQRIGLPYLALCFFLVSLSASSGWTIQHLGPHMPRWLLLPFVNFVAMYFILIMYNMMGYVLYQNHEALGLEVQVDFAVSAESAHRKGGIDPLTHELNGLLSEGNVMGALELLRDRVNKDWENNDLHDRFHKLLMTTERKDEATTHGKQYIAKLLNEKKLGRVLDIYDDCLKLDPDFRGTEANNIYHLASTAHSVRRAKLALAIMRQFDKRNPGHPDIPAVYLLAAKILHEDLRDDRSAQALLAQICTKYPEHPQRVKAEEYLEFMRKVANAGI